MALPSAAIKITETVWVFGNETATFTLAECVGTVNVRVSSGIVSWIAFLLQQQAKWIHQQQNHFQAVFKLAGTHCPQSTGGGEAA